MLMVPPEQLQFANRSARAPIADCKKNERVQARRLPAHFLLTAPAESVITCGAAPIESPFIERLTRQAWTHRRRFQRAADSFRARTVSKHIIARRPTLCLKSWIAEAF